MKLQMIWVGALATAGLVACGDDSGGGGGSGGESSTTGASTTTGSGTGTTTGGTTTGGTTSNTTTGSGGEGGAGTGGAGTGGATTGTGGGTAYDCDSYCATIMEACTDANLQYPDAASCLASCPGFPEGEYQDSDSTLGCRAYHAGAALADPDIHCIHAGPLGTGACGGDPCEGFCAIAQTVCTGDDQQFVDEDTCLKVCQSFEVGDYAIPTEGDTLGCRMYHLSVAAQTPNNTGLHCPHIAAESDTCN